MRNAGVLAACLVGLVGCGATAGGDVDANTGAIDAGATDARIDASTGSVDAGGSGSDASAGTADAAPSLPDAALPAPDADPPPPDAAPPPPDADPGVLTGGPCISGATGATAYRVRWIDAGGAAQVVYEVNGLPDTSRDHTGAYGYTIPFTPSFVDPFLGEGGLLLNSSSFVDIELSTAGVDAIDTATLSIYGRSFNVTTSGSFNWQTFSGFGSAPTNLVSNVAPYAWYSADMTTEIEPGDDGVLLRIKAGPSSNSLVVNRIELCMEAR